VEAGSGAWTLSGRQALAGFERAEVVPRHPVGGGGGQLARVLLQFGEVVERIGAVELAGVDEAHEQVADAGAVFGLVEIGVLAIMLSSA